MQTQQVGNYLVDEITLFSAINHATRAADKFVLPQTVYRDNESAGWWHTNPLSSRLEKAEVALTILPECFFGMVGAVQVTGGCYAVSEH